ncbi:hypothetical protein [uncultured Alistipes sp.]|uniref:hypothetical protein n=1 Tax=uncultured Alistipes sp. TaxID=538949 RepID=UPI00260D0A14|nr:hypothetical protein [uncultured Alistipes sp.]
MSKDIYEVLLENYVPEQPLKKRKSIATRERGAIYKADIVPERETVVFVVDGEIITDKNRCDRLILSKSIENEKVWWGHFVELKGVKIEHALVQLEATIQHERCNHPTIQRKFARIVGRSFPASSANPLIEKARIRFRERYKCELKCLKSQQPDKI